MDGANIGARLEKEQAAADAALKVVRMLYNALWVRSDDAAGLFREQLLREAADCRPWVDRARLYQLLKEWGESIELEGR